MMERTDRHFRYLIRLVAPHARVYTEMITAGAILRGDASRLLRFDESEHPVALQLGGSDPDALACAAKAGARAGYDEINLNVGCPSGRVQQASFGAALMLDADRVARAVGAMRAAVPVPVTVKTRLGVDEHDGFEFIAAFVRTVARAGCHSFVIHARKAWLKGLSPKENREIPPLDYARVYRLKAEFPDLEIVLNGGLASPSAVTAALERVDGVMLGRAAYDDPMLIGELDRRLFPAARRARRREEIAGAYCDYMERELARGERFAAMSRHLMGLYAGLPGARRWRRTLGELARDGGSVAGIRKCVRAQTAREAPAAA